MVPYLTFRSQSTAQGVHAKQPFASLCALSLCLLLSNAAQADNTAAKTTIAQQASNVPYEDIQLFVAAYSKIKSDYVEELDDKDMLRNAINGILNGLDPHSTFLNAEAYRDLKIDTEGEFDGLGIEVSQENGFVKVITPIDDTPAFIAGVKAGDIITHIDAKSLQGLSLSEAVKRMRGKPGTAAKLRIVRQGESKDLIIEVVRANIELRSVKTQSLDDNLLYARISHFQLNTTAELKKAIEKHQKNKDSVQGLILDLRNNPGGVLSAAIGISDLFLKKGTIVETKGRLESAYSSAKASSTDILNGAPIIVLVNSGSASASEIVAGALQDHRRGIIVGTTTFGKGSVQTITPINDDSAIKITTARYYTPNGRSIQETGIQPDIRSDLVEVKSLEAEEQRREVSLNGHLENENKQKKRSNKAAKPTGMQQRLKNDSQLRDGYKLLKALQLTQTAKSSE